MALLNGHIGLLKSALNDKMDNFLNYNFEKGDNK